MGAESNAKRFLELSSISTALGVSNHQECGLQFPVAWGSEGNSERETDGDEQDLDFIIDPSALVWNYQIALIL